MCGIAGIVAADRLRTEERVLLGALGAVLAHRGPDDSGIHADEHAGLVHRRLSIVDLKAGHQPLANEDERIWIVFNGEIYNHRDVRRELEAAGHQYRTASDTETIVHAYEQWGDACVDRLRGMFAFAIWDSARCRLLLARDRLGVKPLYWARAGTRLVFGSEIKAILESRLVTVEANAAAIPELLATRYVSGDETLFKGIFKLMPGHVLVFEDGAVRTRQYWDVPLDGDTEHRPERPPRTFRAAVGQFRELLKESVRLRLMSDVPLGMFLSGGLDSSAVAALMAPMVDHQLQTFSVAFRDRAFSELEYARQVARAVGANGHEIVIDEYDFFGALPRLVWHEDEPIAHPSSVPLYFVSKLARDHVKVVLTGEGSDELMAGYGKYPRSVWNWRLGAFWKQLVPDAGRRWIAGRAVPALPRTLGRYARRSFLAVPHRPGRLFFDNFAAIPLGDQTRLLQEPYVGTEAQVYGPSLAYFDSPRAGRLLERLLYTDVKTYLVELLMKQDQMSMAASIESRVPFLDHVLVEFVFSLPSRWKLSGLTTKRLLREAVRGLLPREILERPKMGFPVPFAAWMRGRWQDIARDVLLDPRARQRGVFDSHAVERLLDAHSRGETDGGDRLWSLLNLELWFRTFVDGEGVQTLAQPAGAGAAARETLVA